MTTFLDKVNFRRISSLAVAGLGPFAAAFAKNDRPDIVLLLADDWGYPHATVYGDPGVDSRVLDRIAEEGMLFTHAYSAAPHSSPSRASILTGQYPHRLRDACNLNCYFPGDLRVYPAELEKAGYETVFWHKGWGPGVWAETGWEHNPAGHEVTDLVSYIENAPEDKPICVWMGSRRPHRPYEMGSGEAHGFDPAAIAVSPDLPDSPDVRGDLADYYYNIQLFQDECEAVIEALRKSGRLDNTLLIITGDNGDSFPRAKSNLYDMGCHVPMAVRWPGVIESGSVCDGFVNLMDLCATFYEVAGVEPPEKMDSRSLVPVFKGKKNGTRNEMYFDRERHTNTRPGGYGYPMRSVRTDDFLFIHNFHPERLPAGVDPVFGDTGNGPAKAYMSFHRDEYPAEIFERAFGKRPEYELYDLRTDPYCHKNVAEDKDYASVRKTMEKKLLRWMKDTGDPRVDPLDMSFDTYPYVRRAMKIAVFDIDGCVNGPDGKPYPWVLEQMNLLRGRGVEVMQVNLPEELDSCVEVLDRIRKESGLSGREITVVSDACNGIISAKKAGLIPAGVTWGENDAREMLMAGASYVLSDAEDLALCMDFL